MKLFGYVILKEKDITTAMIRTVNSYNNRPLKVSWTRERWRSMFWKHLNKINSMAIKK